MTFLTQFELPQKNYNDFQTFTVLYRFLYALAQQDFSTSCRKVDRSPVGIICITLTYLHCATSAELSQTQTDPHNSYKVDNVRL